MKLTIMNAEARDIRRVPGLIEAYTSDGYADGSRTRQRDCVIYTSADRTAAVWGGPDHVRIWFPRNLEAPTP